MGRKIFISYKYKDYDVKELSIDTRPTWPCDYVNYIKDVVLESDDIYKGEKSDEDISHLSDTAIWNHLKDKIYDSSIHIKNSIFRNSLIFQGLPPIKYQNLMYFPLFLPL